MSSPPSPSGRTPGCTSCCPGTGKPPGTGPWPHRTALTSRSIFDPAGPAGLASRPAVLAGCLPCARRMAIGSCSPRRSSIEAASPARAAERRTGRCSATPRAVRASPARRPPGSPTAGPGRSWSMRWCAMRASGFVRSTTGRGAEARATRAVDGQPAGKPLGVSSHRAGVPRHARAARPAGHDSGHRAGREARRIPWRESVRGVCRRIDSAPASPPSRLLQPPPGTVHRAHDDRVVQCPRRARPRCPGPRRAHLGQPVAHLGFEPTLGLSLSNSPPGDREEAFSRDPSRSVALDGAPQLGARLKDSPRSDAPGSMRTAPDAPRSSYPESSCAGRVCTRPSILSAPLVQAIPALVSRPVPVSASPPS